MFRIISFWSLPAPLVLALPFSSYSHNIKLVVLPSFLYMVISKLFNSSLASISRTEYSRITVYSVVARQRLENEAADVLVFPTRSHMCNIALCFCAHPSRFTALSNLRLPATSLHALYFDSFHISPISSL